MWWYRVKNLVLGLLIGALSFSLMLPSYSEIIPYDNISIDKETTKYDSNGDYLVELTFRKTACSFDKLFIRYENSGELLTWEDVDGGKGDRKEGWHTIRILVHVDLQKRVDKEAIILITRHKCDDDDIGRWVVVEKAIPGSISRNTKELYVTRILARVEL